MACGTAKQLEYGGIGAADMQPRGRECRVAAAFGRRGERLTFRPLPGDRVKRLIMTQWPSSWHDTAATTFAQDLHGR
jgi:hypothetical protein